MRSPNVDILTPHFIHSILRQEQKRNNFFVKIKNIRSTLEKIEEINEQIKQKLVELKDKEKISANDNVQKLIHNLKMRRDKTIKHLYRRAYRLKKAFPAIDTKEFTEILNKKIEFKHIKNKKEKKGE